MDDERKNLSLLNDELRTLLRRNEELERTLASLAKSEMRCRRLFDTAKDGIILVDSRTGGIIDANQSFIDLTGCPREELLEKKMWEIAPLKGIDAGLVAFRELQTEDRILYDDLPFESKDGGRISVEFVCTAHQLDGAKVIQCNVRDVTQRKRIENELWKLESRFQALFRQAAVGIAIVDFDGCIVENNAQMGEMLGYSEKELQGRHSSDVILAEDFTADEQLLLDLRARKSDSYQTVKRCVRKDGTLLWGLFTVSLIHEARDQSHLILWIVDDITDRKQAEEALYRSESTLRSFYESALLMMGVIELTDEDEIIHIYDNPATARFFSMTREDMGNRPAGDLGAPAEAIREWVARYRQSRKESRPVHFEYIHPSPNGPLWLSATVSPIGPGSSGWWRFSYVAEDITDRKRAEEEIQFANKLLKIQATTDILTGIFNRLKFNDFLDQEIREAQRYKHPLSPIMFDIDHFKLINDMYGHHVGDEVLRETAQLIGGTTRQADIFARWGGEEFMVLSPHSELENTHQLADKLRSLVEKHNYQSCPAKVTCSFGVTRLIELDTAESFTRRADLAMYKAKGLGRNRVEVVDDREADGHAHKGPSLKASA